ncbi:MAG: hypothetical protein DMF58_11650 [Acidobacteria bacterium]|nr:MAG: hypothetical protein DMF58_11650 [Acidobacteriota bacterium]
MYKKNIVLAALIVAIPLIANAQNTRSAVAVTGSDAATCTVPDPCRTFGVALSKTNSGGEVVVLSSGGYGPFEVFQSVTIVSPPGIYAAIAPPSSGTAIRISGPSGNSVVLRGLYLNGSLGGFFGVFVASTGTLVYLENLVIAGFSSSGFTGVHNLQSDVRMKDSFLRNNDIGISLVGTSGTARARVTIDHCRLEGHTYGLSSNNYSDATVTNSLFTGNFRGVSIDSFSADIDARINIDNSVFAQNSVGIFAIRPLALIRVSSSTITQNTQYALDIQQGAQVMSAGNNVVIDNAAKETFTGTFTLQ